MGRGIGPAWGDWMVDDMERTLRIRWLYWCMRHLFPRPWARPARLFVPPCQAVIPCRVEPINGPLIGAYHIVYTAQRL